MILDVGVPIRIRGVGVFALGVVRVVVGYSGVVVIVMCGCGCLSW